MKLALTVFASLIFFIFSQGYRPISGFQISAALRKNVHVECKYETYTR